MNMWESVKSIQFLCGRLDIVHTALHRKLKFLNGLYTRAHYRDEKPERDLTYHLTCLLIYHGTTTHL